MFVYMITYFSLARSFIPSSSAGVTFSLSQRRVGAPAPFVSVPAFAVLVPPLLVVLLGVGAAGGVEASGVMVSGVGVESVDACWVSMVNYWGWGVDRGWRVVW